VTGIGLNLLVNQIPGLEAMNFTANQTAGQTEYQLLKYRLRFRIDTPYSQFWHIHIDILDFNAYISKSCVVSGRK
jgi:hypothetical protein